MFRKRKREAPALRKRDLSHEDEEAPAADESKNSDLPLAERLALARAAQSLRERKTGVDADRLLAGTISDDRANTHAHTSTTAGTTVTDDLTKGRIGLQTTAKATDAYGDRMEEFIHAELAKAAGQAELVQVDEEAEKREALSIPEHLQGPQTEETVLPGHWMTGMQEVGLSKEDQLRIIERTEAAKRELLGRAKELGVPDEEVVVRDTKISRKGIPKSFGDGKKKKKKYQVIASGE